MLKIHDILPAISLDAFVDQEIKKIDLSSYKGKWLLILFYPADFTFVCPTELADAAAHYAEFQKNGAEIVSISTDTAFVHKAWHDTSKAISAVQYPMLADPTGKICQLFGTYLEEEGLSLRASFLLDPDQKLVAMEMHDNSIGRNIEELFRKFQAAKFVYDNGGKIVCPANWHPGEKTLTPGVDLVGKI